MSKNVLCGISICVFLCVLCVKCQKEGATCFSVVDNMLGTCVNQRHCRSVLDAIRTRSHVQICSFSGWDPIICCTDCELVDDVSNYLVDARGIYYKKSGRKAEDKCLEYMLSFKYPCLIEGGLERDLSRGKTCFDYDNEIILGAAGGTDAFRTEFPHMALLGYGKSIGNAQWLCGGSVISDRFILTAAHCVFMQSMGTVKYAALGILKRSDPPEMWQWYKVRRAIRHPKYKPPSKYNDIALLKMDEKIKFNKDVMPACLNTGGSDELYATATGWGAVGNDQPVADTLQVVDLEQFSVEECSDAYPPHRHLRYGYRHASQSCYGNKNNEVINTCQGDSGGPLQITSKYGTCAYDIIGVTSYGRRCGYVGNSGIYTKVEYFVPWIESIVWP